MKLELLKLSIIIILNYQYKKTVFLGCFKPIQILQELYYVEYDLNGLEIIFFPDQSNFSYAK